MTLDYSDAPTWHRAGDVYASLLRQLQPPVADDPMIWGRFAAVITDVSGVDPQSITPDSPLICDDQLWRGMGRTSAMLWVLLIAGVALTAMLVLLLR
ncbi:MAG: hypothetical protein CVT77_07525 [Alphaproteobacteria bacterium HGW-Alphaproteobacteria-16]|nr:MAG: hypothetical protein CVT77_07525 [Alphaproteobacteria bacterium HGW-Alphaproteobacteria-16]